MEKIIKQLMASLAIILSLTATAQDRPDTIITGHERFYTSHWYDECPSYLMDERFRFWAERTDHTSSYCRTIDAFLMEGYTPERAELHEEYAPQRIPIKGISAMVVRDFGDVGHSASQFQSQNQTRIPEYVMLFRYDTSNGGDIVFIDSVRWDTAAPHLIVLPRCAEALENGDSNSFIYCHGYDAYFERPHIVEGKFFTGGTCLNNARTPIYPGALVDIFIYQPTAYFMVVEHNPVQCATCEVESKYYTIDYPFGDSITLYPKTFYAPYFGPFLTIVDTGSYTLTVTTNDSTAGMAYGSGTFRTMTQTAIFAEPNEGYHFIGWSDGNSNNPRMMEIYCDTIVEALFAPGEKIDNPEGMKMNLTPNPATNEIVISMEQSGDYNLTLCDARGRSVATYHFDGHLIRVNTEALAAGVYVAQITANGKTTSKTFVKQ